MGVYDFVNNRPDIRMLLKDMRGLFQEQSTCRHIKHTSHGRDIQNPVLLPNHI